MNLFISVRNGCRSRAPPFARLRRFETEIPEGSNAPKHVAMARRRVWRYLAPDSRRGSGMLALAPLPRAGSSTGRASAQGAPALAMPPDPTEAAAAATLGQVEAAAASAPAPAARVDDKSSPFGAAGRGLCAGHSTGTGRSVILFDLRHQQRPRARRRAVAAAQVRA